MFRSAAKQEKQTHAGCLRINILGHTQALRFNAARFNFPFFALSFLTSSDAVIPLVAWRIISRLAGRWLRQLLRLLSPSGVH